MLGPLTENSRPQEFGKPVICPVIRTQASDTHYKPHDTGGATTDADQHPCIYLEMTLTTTQPGISQTHRASWLSSYVAATRTQGVEAVSKNQIPH